MTIPVTCNDKLVSRCATHPAMINHHTSIVSTVQCRYNNRHDDVLCIMKQQLILLISTPFEEYFVIHRCQVSEFINRKPAILRPCAEETVSALTAARGPDFFPSSANGGNTLKSMDCLA